MPRMLTPAERAARMANAPAPRPARDLDWADVYADAERMEDLQRAEEETGRAYTHTREEHEPCEAGTPACAIDHNRDSGPCETY